VSARTLIDREAEVLEFIVSVKSARSICVCVCVCVKIYTHDDGSAAQECVCLRAQRASLRHTAVGIP